MEVISEPPEANSFVPLLEHQSATPASFYSGPPVLHYHSQRCKVIVLESEMAKPSAIQRLTQDGQRLDTVPAQQANGENVESPTQAQPLAQKIVDDIDVWVTSQNMLLYSQSSAMGVSIPYPSIALHAIQSLPMLSPNDQQALYMQLQLQSPDTQAGEGDEEEEEEGDSISLTIIPQNDAPPPPTVTDPDIEAGDHAPQPPTLAMFTALSDCSNLHPDNVNDPAALEDSTLFQAGMLAPGDANGGLPPAMPGSGGWITAENMGEYFDEDGNWIAGEGGVELTADRGDVLLLNGGGAETGSVRPRADSGDDEDGEIQDSKWRRTG